jgi:hypothetical protein
MSRPGRPRRCVNVFVIAVIERVERVNNSSGSASYLSMRADHRLFNCHFYRGIVS